MKAKIRDWERKYCFDLIPENDEEAKEIHELRIYIDSHNSEKFFVSAVLPPGRNSKGVRMRIRRGY